jgi:hypothetical protein
MEPYSFYYLNEKHKLWPVLLAVAKNPIEAKVLGK